MTTADADLLPTTKQELERKLVDYLVWSEHHVANLRRGGTTQAVVAKALWHVCSGLVDPEILNLAAEASRNGDNEEMVMRFRQKATGQLIVVRWSSHGKNFTVTTYPPGAAEVLPTVTVDCDLLGRPPKLKKFLASLFKADYLHI